MKTFQLKCSWLREASPYTGKLLLYICHAISLLYLVNHVDMNLMFFLLMDYIFLTTFFLGHRINLSCFLKTNIVVNNKPLKEKKNHYKLFQTCFINYVMCLDLRPRSPTTLLGPRPNESA